MDIEFLKNFLLNSAPFSKLKPKEIEALSAVAEVHEYRDKDIIYHSGDPSDYFYLLLQGRVVAVSNIDGQPTEIELLKRGTIFGIISLFNEEPHSVTAKVIENSWVMRVEKNKFKQFIEENPRIALDLARVLSQRVKVRTGPKKIFQSKRVGILGFAASGKTTYALNLGAQLKDATKKEVICIEIVKDVSRIPIFRSGQEVKPFNLRADNEALAKDFIVKDVVDYLMLVVDEGGDVSGLVNLLSEQYHFIICEAQVKLLDEATINFIYRCDFVHMIFNSSKIELAKGGGIIKDFEERHFFDPEKIKVIINDFNNHEKLDLEARRKLIGRRIYATLPEIGTVEYAGVIKRIARETGEVVLGVALGSGGSYGFAHIGVLEVLEENNIPIDIVCGSSMGSFVAAMWAAGFDSKRMRQAAYDFGRRLKLFSFPGFYFPFKGIIRAKRLERVYHDIFGDITFYDLKHPLKLAAFDFFQRKATVLEDGPLYRAVAASCAIPGVFEPIQYAGGLILDGGVLNPLPTKILVNYNVHKIIAVNVTPPRENVATNRKAKGRWNVFDFIFGSIETMQREFVGEALRFADVVIHPVFYTTDWAQFDRTDEFIQTGREATIDKLDTIRRLVAE
jgi:NTE family protein